MTIFASAYLSSDELKEFADGPFKVKATLPFRSPVEGARELVSSVRNGLKEDAGLEALNKSSVDMTAASRIVGYMLYKMKKTEYVPPTPPPIFIPEKVEPIPTVDIYETDTPPAIDGRLAGPVWEKASKIRVTETNLGLPASQPSDVLLTYDRDNLYVGVRLFDPNANDLSPKVTVRDGAVFYEDSVELFLDPQGIVNASSVSGKVERGYFHLATNLLGTRFDQKTLEPGWNGDWRVATRKGRQQLDGGVRHTIQNPRRSAPGRRSALERQFL